MRLSPTQSLPAKPVSYPAHSMPAAPAPIGSSRPIATRLPDKNVNNFSLFTLANLALPDDSSSQSSNSNEDDPLQYIADAPHASISAMSSRRPSYAAEFSSRPRPESFNALSPSMSNPLGLDSAALADTDRWFASARSAYSNTLWRDRDTRAQSQVQQESVFPDFSRSYRSVSYSSEANTVRPRFASLRDSNNDVFYEDDDDVFPAHRHNLSDAVKRLSLSAGLSGNDVWARDSQSRRYSFDAPPHYQQPHNYPTVGLLPQPSERDYVPSPVVHDPFGYKDKVGSSVSHVEHAELDYSIDRDMGYSAAVAMYDSYFSDHHERNEQFHLCASGIGPASRMQIPPNVPEPTTYAKNNRMYCLEFKAGRLDIFYLADGSGLDVKIGDVMVVDADRGRDLGRVTHDNVSLEMAQRIKVLQHQEQQIALQHGIAGEVNLEAANVGAALTPKQIIRFAQPVEIQQLGNKRTDEEKARQMCLRMISERRLAMDIVDAEYQWDRRKLTFFYSASRRVDFRDLVRELFRAYKTRIWMCAVLPRPEEEPK